MPATPDPNLSAFVRRLVADPAIVVLEGFHSLKHGLRFGAEIELALTADRQALEALAAELAPDVAPVLRQTVREVTSDVISLAVDRPPRTGVVSFARRPVCPIGSVLEAEGLTGAIVLLEDPQDLGNVGAVVRVAAAAGASAVLTSGRHDPWDRRALRGSAGLHFALPVARVLSPVELGGRPLVALDANRGEPLGSVPIPPRAVLAFGSERRGLSRELAERAVLSLRIPMRAGVSSLNLATSVAVVLYAR